MFIFSPRRFASARCTSSAWSLRRPKRRMDCVSTLYFVSLLSISKTNLKSFVSTGSKVIKCSTPILKASRSAVIAVVSFSTLPPCEILSNSPFIFRIHNIHAAAPSPLPLQFNWGCFWFIDACCERVVLGCVNEFEVGQCFPSVHGCAGLSSQVVHHAFFFLVSSSLIAVVCSCGTCFWVVLRYSWLSIIFSVSWSNKCLNVSIFECGFRLFKLFNVCNPYGLFQVVFMLFSVVLR